MRFYDDSQEAEEVKERRGVERGRGDEYRAG